MRRALMVSALLLAAASAAHAQSRPTVELRVGAMASTPLVVDSIARAFALRGVGITDREAEAERMRQGVSPVIELAVRSLLRPRLAVEASIGFTHARIQSSSDDGSVQSIGVPHAGVGLRYQVYSVFHASGGFGGVRYGAGEGLFAGLSSLQPMLHAAAGAGVSVSGFPVSVEIFAQGHSFGAPALQRAGGSDGRVLRVGARTAIAFGGPR